MKHRPDGYPPQMPPPRAGNVFEWILRETAAERAARRTAKVIGAMKRPVSPR